MVTLKIKVTFDEEVLGTGSANRNAYADYIAANAPDSAKMAEEVESIEDVVEENGDKGMTIFSRDDNGNPILWDYQWKGYFKDAFKSLRKLSGSKCAAIKNYKQEIDGLIFVTPRKIPINLNGGEMDVCQRPLRASTAQGERIALACSETIPVGSSVVFDIQLLSKNHEKAIIESLNYGRLRGFGQWRNSGKGRFHYEILDRKEDDDLF